MDNQHKMIKGYRDLSQEEIDGMNFVKALGKECGEMIDRLQANGFTDKRCVAIAKTKLQEGFMWAVRSIARPESF